MAILPGGEEFARLVAAAYYMTKKGVIDFQTFLLELKAKRIIDDISSLSAKEKLTLKDAFEQGKSLREADPGLIDDLDAAIQDGNFAKAEKIINQKKREFSW